MKTKINKDNEIIVVNIADVEKSTNINLALKIMFIIVIILELIRAIYCYCIGDWREGLNATNMFIWVGLAYWFLRDGDKLRKVNEMLYKSALELSKTLSEIAIENKILRRRVKDPEYNKLWNDIEDGAEAFADYYNNVIAKMDNNDIDVKGYWDNFENDSDTDTDTEKESDTSIDNE